MEEESKELVEQFNHIIDSLSQLKTKITDIQQEVKELEKKVKKQVKIYKKETEKSKNKGNRKPSGFAKPTKVTKELCDFLNQKEGTEIARTEVTKTIIQYIQTHNLQNKENTKLILPDDKLKFLLGIDDKEELTFFNLQKYMNKHFLSKNSSEI
jgi:chromatin remodeling complex protein RSC6